MSRPPVIKDARGILKRLSGKFRLRYVRLTGKFVAEVEVQHNLVSWPPEREAETRWAHECWRPARWSDLDKVPGLKELL